MEVDEFESEDDDERKPWQHEDAPPTEAGRGGEGDGEGQGPTRRTVSQRVNEDRTMAGGLDEDSHRPSSMWW